VYNKIVLLYNRFNIITNINIYIYINLIEIKILENKIFINKIWCQKCSLLINYSYVEEGYLCFNFSHKNLRYLMILINLNH